MVRPNLILMSNLSHDHHHGLVSLNATFPLPWSWSENNDRFPVPTRYLEQEQGRDGILAHLIASFFINQIFDKGV